MTPCWDHYVRSRTSPDRTRCALPEDHQVFERLSVYSTAELMKADGIDPETKGIIAT